MFKKSCIPLLVLLFSCSLLTHAQYKQNEPLAHTFSIVAVDSATGDIGVAVQSHWFSVGTSVAWAEAGTGAVATQSLTNVSFGPRGLAMMKKGIDPQQALDSLLAADEGSPYRQVALIDKDGNVAVHTGSKCIAKAGHIKGTHFSVQANMMLNDTVWPAMAEAFRASESQPLAERLVAALQAAQAEGGDIRGQQSAALTVVKGESSGKPWEDRKVELRVDDNAHAVVEIARLLKVHRAYEHMNNGDLAIEKGDVKKALQEYGAAQSMFPQNVEMKYWTAISLVNAGRMEQAVPLLRQVFEADKNWRELTRRIVPNGMLQVSKEELKHILSIGTSE